MANTKSTHQIAVKAVDGTGPGFLSIQQRAAATQQQIQKMVAGGLAAAGSYLGFSAITSNVKEMGQLSDMAMKAGASVEELTRASAAFQVAGLDIGVGQLTRSLMFLEKNTGKAGMGAFYDTIDKIAAIEDPAKRGAALVENFGRAGLELQPLVSGGADAAQKMRDLASIMPGVSTAAANVGDEYADAMTIIGNGTKSILQGALGKLLSYFSEAFPGGVRAGALNAMNWLETFFKKCHAWIAKVGTEIMSFGALVGDVFTMGPQAAWQMFLDTNAAADREFEERIAAANKSRAEYVEKLGKFNADDLANALGSRRGKIATTDDAAKSVSSKAIRNDLILAGSNDAAKLAAFGPQYQSETKKQTALLEKIAENTEQTKDAVENVDIDEIFKELNS